MNCMRCGIELKKDGQVFCSSCQEGMKTCPVPSGTPIQLPVHKVAEPTKRRFGRKKKEQNPEEQIAQLRHTVGWLCFALVVTVLAFALTAAVLIHTLDQPEIPLGRNFGTSQSADGK